MEISHDLIWLKSIRETVTSYRRMIDACTQQLSDAEFTARPMEGLNSVANLLRHLGGNLRSRWTDFLTTDGEKPDRDRDTEFVDWEGDRESLMEYFNLGWETLLNAIDSLNDENIDTTVFIRGEPHSIPQALTRSVTHVAYHTGQIAIISRTVHEGQWEWLTIAPGSSTEHNEKTWGTSNSRSVFSREDGIRQK